MPDGVLPPAERTIAEILKDSGYTTLAVVAHDYARCKWGVCQGFDVVDEDYEPPEKASRTRAKVTQLLDRHLGERFFLWVHFREPHSPYHPSKAIFDEFYDARVIGPTFYSSFLKHLSFLDKLDQLVAHYGSKHGEHVGTYRLDGKPRKLTPTIIDQLVAMYDGNVREVDTEFGVLMSHLAAAGIADNTIVVLSADHGESMGEHGVFDHNFLWYSILHTPLIVHVPDAPHNTFQYPVMNVDIFPTILQLLEIEVPDGIRGISLFNDNREAYFQFAEYLTSKTVVRGDFKLILGWGKHRGAHLFNIATDPSETKDLSVSHASVVRELSQIARFVEEENLARDPAAPDTPVRDILRSLGYIE